MLLAACQTNNFRPGVGIRWNRLCSTEYSPRTSLFVHVWYTSNVVNP